MADVEGIVEPSAPSPSEIDTDQARPKTSDGLFAAAMPKEEIGALAFLKEHKESDGRGVIVAIFDTGVDAGAEGLQQTTDGKKKIIDVVDGTGSGDVDTSTIVVAEGNNIITGLHGDKLEVNPAWTNPSGKWHVGAKHLFELVPKSLSKRLKDERRKLWDQKQSAAVTAAWNGLDEASKAAAKAKGPEGKLKAVKLEEEHKNRTQLLKDMAEKFEDAGPLLQCVVWHDGSHWRAAIDSSDMYEPDSSKGKLADFEPLSNYKTEHKYGTFSSLDRCNFVCNIYEEGEVLSIVVDSGSHGTHVAGITAAYQPDNPSLNGIAPGAQIISCKIGDSRLDGMETGTGLTRALITVLEHKADLINMSFGEATSTPNFGRFIDLANEVVHKHGVIFVSSAGNAGPALSTVGAPGGTSSSILSIGAYVSPAMAAVAHSVRQELPQGQQYTWSSRGPTPDGHFGVTLSAPGGAIAPVPQWTQQVRQLMNGTSMSSPNACGGIALLLSAMKQHSMAITPNRVRRALENTCLPLKEGSPDGVLTHGRGLLQVHKAFEYIRKSEKVDKPDTRYEVTARRSDSSTSQRGILLREPLASLKAATFICEVQPKLHEDAEMEEKLGLYDEVLLECTSSWFQAPKALILPHNGRTFEVKVDPVGLEEGLHYGEVQGYDSKARWRGPLFRVPVTVMKPAAVSQGTSQSSGAVPLAMAPLGTASGPLASSSSIYSPAQSLINDAAASQGVETPGASQDFIARLGEVRFQPGTERRFFFAVPEGATWGEMMLKAGPHDTPRNFMLRATQILPHTRYSDSEARTYASLSAHARHAMHFKLTAGATLEITLSQFWSSFGEGILDVEVALHGVEAQGSGFIDGPNTTAQVHVRAPFRSEKINPSAKLKTYQTTLRPTDYKLQPSKSPVRDQLPQGRTIHTLLLTYKFTVEAEGKFQATVPMLNRYVYDGEFEGQMSMLHDANKRLLKVSDIYPSPVDLKKGEYIIRLQLRHEDAALLDKLNDLPVVVKKKLKEPITVPVYANNRDAVKAGKAVKDRSLHPGERVAYFVGPVPQDKLPKEAAAGGSLTGSLQLGLLQGSKEHAPASLPLFYRCGPKGKEKGADKTDEKEEEEKPSLEKAVWEAKLKVLQGLHPDAKQAGPVSSTQPADPLGSASGQAEQAQQQQHEEEEAKQQASKDDKAEQLEQELLSQPELTGADKLTVLRAKLKHRNASLKSDPQAVVETATEVIGAVDQAALAQFVAQKSPEEGPGAAKKKKEMGEIRAGLVDALEKKTQALLLLHPGTQHNTPEAEGSADQVHEAALDSAVAEQAGGANGKEGRGEAQAAAQQQPSEDDPVETAFSELRKWVDPSEAQYALLSAKREARLGRCASAIKALSKASQPEDKPPPREVLELRAELFGKLGWLHWQRHELALIRTLFPKAYPVF